MNNVAFHFDINTNCIAVVDMVDMVDMPSAKGYVRSEAGGEASLNVGTSIIV
jgi:hypothetical protein